MTCATSSLIFLGSNPGRLSEAPTPYLTSEKGRQMPPTLKHRIIGLLARDPSPRSISDIARKLGVAYSHAHSFIRQLISEDIVRTQKIGNVLVCSLNMHSQSTCAHLAVIESERASEWRRKNPHFEKTLEKIDLVKDYVHAILVKNNNVVIIVPEKLSGADFSMFRNRTVLTAHQVSKKRDYYKDCVIVYGAERFWSLLSD